MSDRVSLDQFVYEFLTMLTTMYPSVTRIDIQKATSDGLDRIYREQAAGA